ncbi:MAG: lipopolysaccharide heptosyltransferase family protein [Acidobacteria bacterium]|nr:MAG: lipopolysaccharide heptosyltransferase family protein [Acidobacteriota bacterium]
MPTSTPPPERDPRRILVVRLGAVGDIVRTLPAVRRIRRRWPGARIAWAVERGPHALIEGHPDLDRLIVLDRRALAAAARRLSPAALTVVRAFRGALRDFAPDVALDFQASFKSGLVAWLSGAPSRWGFAAPHAREGSHLFANRRVPLPEPRIHRVERALALAAAAGAANGPVEADLALREDERAAGAVHVRELAGARPAVAVAPLTSRRQAWKRYPLERWAEVCRGLAAAGCRPLAVGGPGEEPEIDALVRASGGAARPLGAIGLRELAAALAACKLLVAGDTGPMHLAWAVGTPVVAVYGPTDPVLNAPWGDGHVVLAPPRRTARHEADRFPGITPERIVEAACERLGLAVPRDGNARRRS